MHTRVYQSFITLAGPPWIAVSFREHRNAGNCHEGYEKIHPERTCQRRRRTLDVQNFSKGKISMSAL